MLHRSVAASVLLFIWANPSLSFESGQQVVATTDLEVIAGGKPVDTIAAGQMLRVIRVEGDKLWVSRGRPGTIPSSQVVELEAAEAHFQRRFASGAGPKDYLSRGTVRIALGRHDEGIADLEKAIELAGTGDAYLEPLAFAQLAAQNQEAAIKTFKRCVKANPESAGARMGLGLAYFQVGQNRNSYVELAKAVELEPLHAFPRKYLGAILHDVGKPELAKEQLEAAASLDPHDAFTHKSLGRLFYDLNDYDQALEHFQQAVEINPSDVEAIAGRGVVQQGIGTDLRAAEADYRRAIELSALGPENAYLLNNLGHVQLELNEYRESYKSLSRCLELDPDFTEARSHRVHLVATQAPDRAPMDWMTAEIETIFASNDDRTYWDYQAKAAVLALQKDFSQALQVQTTADRLLKKTGPKRFEPKSESLLKTYRRAAAGG
ncbi:MAG: tetratricopeptide repeat protein [Planctomycetota bacterium]